MKKLLLFLVLLLSLTAAAAETAEVTPTPSPTPVPEMIAQPDATKTPITTATPRPTDAPLPEDPFMAHAVEIARRIDLLAKSGTFRLCGMTAFAEEEAVEAVSWGEHTWPEHVYQVKGEALVAAMTDGVADSAWLDMSRPEIRRDLVKNLPDLLLYGMEEEKTSIISDFARMKVFASDVPESCGFMVMLYADAAPIVLPWYAEGGAVQISAYFMPDEKLAACASAEEVAAWLAEKGLPPVAFEEVRR